MPAAGNARRREPEIPGQLDIGPARSGGEDLGAFLVAASGGQQDGGGDDGESDGHLCIYRLKTSASFMLQSRFLEARVS